MERLHDELCPEFKAQRRETYYTIRRGDTSYFPIMCFSSGLAAEAEIEVTFPSQEIAQQACDILNAKLKQTKE